MRYIIYFYVFVMTLIIGYTSYALVDRVSPLTYKFVSINPSSTVNAGGRISINWEVTSRRVCSGTFSRAFTDANGRLFQYTPIDALQFDVGQHKVTGPSFAIPETMALGTATYHGVGLYYCNFTHLFWPIRYVYPTVTFEVVK